MRERPNINYQETICEDEDLEVDYDSNPTGLYSSICDEDWESSLITIENNPIECRTWVVKRDLQDDYGGGNDTYGITCRFLPIHSAAARNPPFKIMTALLRAYPEGASRRDDNGMYPLHYACANRASVEIVRLLLDSFPGANLSRVECNGMLPIHLAAQWGVSSLNVISMLLEGNNSISCARDNEGNTPFELAIDAHPYLGRDRVLKKLRDAMEIEIMNDDSDESSISTNGFTVYSSNVVDIRLLLRNKLGHCAANGAECDDYNCDENLIVNTALPTKNSTFLVPESKSLKEDRVRNHANVDVKRYDQKPPFVQNINLNTDYNQDMLLTDEAELITNLKTEMVQLRIQKQKIKIDTDKKLTEMRINARIAEIDVITNKVKEMNTLLGKDLISTRKAFEAYSSKAEALEDIMLELISNQKLMMKEQKECIIRARDLDEQLQTRSANRLRKFKRLMEEEKIYYHSISDDNFNTMSKINTQQLFEEEEAVLNKFEDVLNGLPGCRSPSKSDKLL